MLTWEWTLPALPTYSSKLTHDENFQLSAFAVPHKFDFFDLRHGFLHSNRFDKKLCYQARSKFILELFEEIDDLALHFRKRQSRRIERFKSMHRIVQCYKPGCIFEPIVPSRRPLPPFSRLVAQSFPYIKRISRYICPLLAFHPVVFFALVVGRKKVSRYLYVPGFSANY